MNRGDILSDGSTQAWHKLKLKLEKLANGFFRGSVAWPIENPVVQASGPSRELSASHLWWRVTVQGVGAVGTSRCCRANSWLFSPVSQPEERSLARGIVHDLPQSQEPVAHGCQPDHFELAFFLIGKAKVGTGGAAKDEHVTTSLDDAVRVDDVAGKRSHVPGPGVTVCFQAGQRRFLQNLEPMVGGHESD